MGCVNYHPNANLWFFLDEFFSYYRQYLQYPVSRYANNTGSDNLVRHILEMLVSVLESCQHHPSKKPREGTCFNYFRMLKSNNMWRLTPQVVHICNMLDKIGYHEDRGRILDFFFSDIDSTGPIKQLIQDMNHSPAFAGAFIDCCYYAQQNQCFGGWKLIDFYNFEQCIIEQMDSVEALLPDHEESFYHLLCLICLLCDEEEVSWRHKGLPFDEAERIVQKYGERLSIRTLKKLAEYGKKADYTCLELAIERLLQV